MKSVNIQRSTRNLLPEEKTIKTSEDPRVHDLAEKLDLEALKALPADVLRQESHTVSTNRHGYLTWAITNAVRSEEPGKTTRERIEVVDYLVQHHCSLEGALVFAAWRGHTELIQHLIKVHKVKVDGRVPSRLRGVDGTGNGETAIHGALIMKNNQLVKDLIVKHNANVNEAYDKHDENYCGETALHIACVSADLDMVKVRAVQMLCCCCSPLEISHM